MFDEPHASTTDYRAKGRGNLLSRNVQEHTETDKLVREAIIKRIAKGILNAYFLGRLEFRSRCDGVQYPDLGGWSTLM